MYIWAKLHLSVLLLYVWCPNMTNDTSLESSCALLLESAKKCANLQKLNFYSKIELYSKNVCKKNLSKNEKLYIFKKPLTMPFQICRDFCKILNNLIFNQVVQFLSLSQRLSKKLNFIKIWQVEVGQNKDLVCYRKKQSFRQCAWGLRQLILKPGFRPKGRALDM